MRNGAEGATAPETLRQMDRDRQGTLESAFAGFFAKATEGESADRAFDGLSQRPSSQVTRQRGQEFGSARKALLFLSLLYCGNLPCERPDRTRR